jgi:hypothetical protein
MVAYVTLVNELLRRLNEVQLDSAGADFSSARNVQALAKDAINNSIREILQYNQEWPFTLTTYTETMVVGTGVYSLPANASKVDWDTFYLKRLTSADNQPKKLQVVTYNDYLRTYRPQEDTGGTDAYTVPEVVYQTQDLKFGVTPIPDAAYEIEYRYWSFPDDLTLYTDVCIIPDRFKHVIIDGAMMYMMRFRSNDQQGEIHRAKFVKGLEDMRSLLLDSPQYLRSTVLIGNRNNRTF